MLRSTAFIYLGALVAFLLSSLLSIIFFFLGQRTDLRFLILPLLVLVVLVGRLLFVILLNRVGLISHTFTSPQKRMTQHSTLPKNETSSQESHRDILRQK